MKAWLLCESCVHAETSSVSPRYDVILDCTSCAESCFAIVTDLVSLESNSTTDRMLNGLLHCRKAASTCSNYDQEEIKNCSDVCDECAEVLKQLIPFSLN